MSKYIKATVLSLLRGGCELSQMKLGTGCLRVCFPERMGSYVLSLYPDRLVISEDDPAPRGWLQEELTRLKIPFVIEDTAESLPEAGKRHPIQPIEADSKGTVRFKENKIVRDLYDLYPKHGLDLNKIVLGGYPREDLVQFYQLIGYSISGYGELQAVTDQDYNAAAILDDNPEMTSTEARLEAAEGTLEEIRTLMATPIALLYGIHEDDFKHWRP